MCSVRRPANVGSVAGACRPWFPSRTLLRFRVWFFSGTCGKGRRVLGPVVVGGVDTTATKPAWGRVVALSIHNLYKLFYPHSVAVVGATNQDNEPGNFVMHNLLQGGFEGPIMPVTDREHAIAGVLAYPRVDALPITPDLAVVCR